MRAESRRLLRRLGSPRHFGVRFADVPGNELAEDFGAVAYEPAERLPERAVDGEQGAEGAVLAASVSALVSHGLTVVRGYHSFNVAALLSITVPDTLGISARISAQYL